MIITECIARLREVKVRSNRGPWPTIPGFGMNEDDGTMIAGSVGPDYPFLAGDQWEYEPDPRPMGLYKEADAQMLAKADQDFIALASSCFGELVSVCEAASRLQSMGHPREFTSEVDDENLSQLWESLTALVDKMESKCP